MHFFKLLINFMAAYWLHSSAFGRELYRTVPTVPCHTVAPLRTVPGWVAWQTFTSLLWKVCQSVPLSEVPIWYTLHPTPGCDTLHTSWAGDGFAFRRSSRYSSTVRFALHGTLWTTSGSGLPWHAPKPIWHRYSSSSC